MGLTVRGSPCSPNINLWRSGCTQLLLHPLCDYAPTLEKPAQVAKAEQVHSVWLQKTILLLLWVDERHGQMA